MILQKIAVNYFIHINDTLFALKLSSWGKSNINAIGMSICIHCNGGTRKGCIYV
jgi:hypothetical protein